MVLTKRRKYRSQGVSATVFIVKISLVIFLVEGLIMYTLPMMPARIHMLGTSTQWFFPMLDVTVLVAFASPLVYFWVVRPYVLARQEAENWLKRKRDMFIEAQQLGQIGSWEVNEAHDGFYWSAQMHRIFDTTPQTADEALAALFQNVHPNETDEIKNKFNVFFQGSDTLDVTFRILTKDGQPKWLRAHAKSGRDGATGSSKIYGTVQDITSQKEAETAKSEFISVMSHELRTPMTSVIGGLRLVTSGAAGKLPKKARSLLDIAEKNAARLLLLVNDILDLVRMDAGKMAYELEEVNLNDILQKAITDTADFARLHQVEVAFSAVDEPLNLHGDQARLVQVMTNLLSNAIKFSPKGSTVKIEAGRDNGSLRLTIKDHGKGIAKDQQSKVFDRFTLGEASDHHATGGSGLGLTIAKAIVTAHGGEIELVSEPGQGATFGITLPAQIA
ncbi:MAG: PAS domain-containing protein [Alphaproteobacteria bacterium]|nr:PAS domain-containing protein [Alphaproteobacteria bacterium]